MICQARALEQLPMYHAWSIHNDELSGGGSIWMRWKCGDRRVKVVVLFAIVERDGRQCIECDNCVDAGQSKSKSTLLCTVAVVTCFVDQYSRTVGWWMYLNVLEMRRSLCKGCGAFALGPQDGRHGRLCFCLFWFQWFCCYRIMLYDDVLPSKVDALMMCGCSFFGDDWFIFGGTSYANDVSNTMNVLYFSLIGRWVPSGIRP